jgi:hypothetical protein
VRLGSRDNKVTGDWSKVSIGLLKVFVYSVHSVQHPLEQVQPHAAEGSGGVHRIHIVHEELDWIKGSLVMFRGQIDKNKFLMAPRDQWGLKNT